MLSVGWSATLLGALLLTGASGVAADDRRPSLPAHSASASSRPLVVIFYVLLLTLVNELGSLPLSYHNGFLVERRYRPARTRRSPAWLRDQLKSWLLGTGPRRRSRLHRLRLHCGVAQPLVDSCGRRVCAAHRRPREPCARPAASRCSTRSSRSNGDVLRQRLLDLARRAGARSSGAYEVGFGREDEEGQRGADRSLGATRRILVSDTMLSSIRTTRSEVVLAHELAHHDPRRHLEGPALRERIDPRGVSTPRPWCWRAWPDRWTGRRCRMWRVCRCWCSWVAAVSLVMIPVANALSRAYERSADRFALSSSPADPSAFVSAMRRLGAQNLAEDDPSRLVQWLFYSHPPLGERIASLNPSKPDW